MPFAALADLKNQLNIPQTDLSNDTELTDYLNAADGACAKRVGPSTVTTKTELQSSTFAGGIVLMKSPLVSVTSVTPIVGTVLQPAVDPSLYEVDLDRNGLVITGGGGQDYLITYTYGWATVPLQGKLACLMIAQHLWRTQRGGQVASVIPDDTMSMVPGFGFAIPQSALELLNSLNDPSAVPGIA
jgi:hypothetical protein